MKRRAFLRGLAAAVAALKAFPEATWAKVAPPDGGFLVRPEFADEIRDALEFPAHPVVPQPMTVYLRYVDTSGSVCEEVHPSVGQPLGSWEDG